jgi:crotonobetainyl-CoA:carnitine CoA-transferase CaiB-like acyl-CoA transferase
MKLLRDILILDFSQFLSGPSAGLRLADFGARVIKIERKGKGDICREMYVSDTEINGDSTIFHAINRNKESYEVDLKNPQDLLRIKELIKKADVLIHNFRPGVMERLGLSYDSVKTINPQLVYACINGYGNKGRWKARPGQDLLLQAVSGIAFLSGNRKDNPTPMGVSVADILSGTHLCQGILAALFKRFSVNEGALVEVSMLESIIDFQFEVLTCFYNDGNKLPRRSSVNNGHAYIGAPYGIYKTANSYLALAMGNIPILGKVLGCNALLDYLNTSDWYDKRDEIKKLLQDFLIKQSTEKWLSVLEPADVWCAEVFDYDMLTKHEGYKVLEMEQEVAAGKKYLKTTRCPIRVDGRMLKSPKGAPSLGEHTNKIRKEFGL